MEKACNDSFQYVNLPHDGSGMELAIRPINIYDIDDKSKNILISEVQNVPENNLLILILGISQLSPGLNELSEPILTSYKNGMYIIGIDPDPNLNKTSDLSYFNVYKDKILDTKLIAADFPLGIYNADVFGGGVGFLSPGGETHLFLNSLSVLKEIINYNGDVLIISHISGLCYKSLKYILDIRTFLGKQTNVLKSYGDNVCDKTPIFTNLYHSCKDFLPIDKRLPPKFISIKIAERINEKDRLLSEYTKENFGIETPSIEPIKFSGGFKKSKKYRKKIKTTKKYRKKLKKTKKYTRR